MYATYQRCQGTSLIPGGMNIRRYKGKLYALDPRSPLSARDFVCTLSRGTTVRDLTRVANKLGLRFKNSKAETKALICDSLSARKIAEPVLLSSPRSRNSSVNNRTVSLGGSLGNGSGGGSMGTSGSLGSLGPRYTNNSLGSLGSRYMNNSLGSPSGLGRPKISEPGSSNNMSNLQKRLNALANKV